MRKIFIISFAILALILTANLLIFKDLYRRQIVYYTQLLDRQVQIVGQDVDAVSNGFLSDLNQIAASLDMQAFFSGDEDYHNSVDRLKLFYTKYESLINALKIDDNSRNEFSLRKPSQTEDWLEQSFRRHSQINLENKEKLLFEEGRYNYYVPVGDNSTGEIYGNIVVTLDLQKFFTDLFGKYKLRDYQWQWVVSDSGQVIFDNYSEDRSPLYSDIGKISRMISRGSMANMTHKASVDGKSQEIISSYITARILQKDMGLVFSALTGFFQKFIIRNSILTGMGSMILIGVIMLVFVKSMRSMKRESDTLRASEATLFKLLDEMPVGVIIHDQGRKVLKANKVAAGIFSFGSEAEMQGTIYEEPVFAGNGHARPGGPQMPHGEVITIPREGGDMVLFRRSIPVRFSGNDAVLEILTDVTMFESARKQEEKANIAKSEFLARMSAEIRTPLNGIIGMADVLNRYDLNPETRDIIRVLYRSTEVLLNIVNDILDFSKIESGKIVINELPFSLRDEINYCIDLAKTSVPIKVQLTWEVAGAVPDRIIGDPFRLRQVIINLLKHSISNTPKGEIRLSCDLRNRSDGRLLIGFMLLDTGRLFDRNALKRFFSDKKTLDSRLAGANDESLLGTVVSNQLIGLMGGSLEATCPSGLQGDTGTKIDFTISAWADERIEKKVDTAGFTSYGSIRTLVITGPHRDEDTIGVLHELGLDVTVTSFMQSTADQIRMNAAHPSLKYSLLVIFDDDKFNGFDAASSLWAGNLTGHFIIFLISSNDRKGNYMRCTQTGIDEYLVKPPDGELMSAVRKHFPNAAIAPKMKPGDNRSRVLIVEDNRMNQKVLSTMLGKLGYSYDVVEDGYDAFLQAKATRYDYIFMDLMLPEMDGFEASRKILKHDKTVRIFAFTADNLPETRKKAELSGISDFLSKPVRIDDLRKLFDRHSRK